MRLKNKIGHPLQCAVGTKRGDDVVRYPDMNVERGDHIGESLSRRRVTAGDEVVARTPQSDAGQAQRLLTIVGGEHAARRHDPRLAARRQGVEVGIDNGMLNLGERRARSFLGPRLRP